MSTDAARMADEFLRYYEELVGRMARTGVRDVGEVLGLAAQVQRALAAVSRQEIDWAAERVDALLAELTRIEMELATVKRLKLAVGG